MTQPVSQHDCILPSSGLRARLFYPTTASIGEYPSAHWMVSSQGGWGSNENAKALAEYLRLPRLSVPMLTITTAVTLPWVADAPPSSRKLPLVLFSHGLAGTLGAYATVCHDIASTGRLVVALEHADGTAQVAYTGSERTRVPYRRVSPHSTSDDEFELRHSQLRQRVAELGDVLDDIRKLSTGVHPLQTPLPPPGEHERRVDLTDIIDADAPVCVAGHSFGACTALAFTVEAARGHKDARVHTAICLDPWLYPLGFKQACASDVGATRVLFVDQEHSGMTSSLELRKSLPAPSAGGRYWALKVLGGGHNNASDFATRLPLIVAVRFGLTPKDSDPNALQRTQNTAVLAFLRDDWPQFFRAVENQAVRGLAPSLLPEHVVA